MNSVTGCSTCSRVFISRKYGAVAVPVHDELDRAGGVVTDRAAELQRGVEKLCAHAVGKVGRRGLFQELLVVALDRAVALEQVHEVAGAVAGELHFEMARIEDEFLEQDRAVAEGGFGFRFGSSKRGLEILGVVDAAHAAAAAAGGGLDQHGKADPARLAHELGFALVVAVIAGHGRHAGRLRDPLRFDLRAHLLDRSCGGADEDETGGFAALHEVGVLRQEAVAGMDRVRAGLAGGGEDGVDVEIAGACRRRADPDRLVGGLHMRRLCVGVGIDGDGADAEPRAGSHDAERDLAAIGDQDRTDGAGAEEKRHGQRSYIR